MGRKGKAARGSGPHRISGDRSSGKPSFLRTPNFQRTRPRPERGYTCLFVHYFKPPVKPRIARHRPFPPQIRPRFLFGPFRHGIEDGLGTQNGTGPILARQEDLATIDHGTPSHPAPFFRCEASPETVKNHLSCQYRTCPVLSVYCEIGSAEISASRPRRCLSKNCFTRRGNSSPRNPPWPAPSTVINKTSTPASCRASSSRTD